MCCHNKYKMKMRRHSLKIKMFTEKQRGMPMGQMVEQEKWNLYDKDFLLTVSFVSNQPLSIFLIKCNFKWNKIPWKFIFLKKSFLARESASYHFISNLKILKLILEKTKKKKEEYLVHCTWINEYKDLLLTFTRSDARSYFMTFPLEIPVVFITKVLTTFMTQTLVVRFN